MSELTERTKRFWARAAEPDWRSTHVRTNWMAHREVQRHVNRRCSGDPDRTWLDYFCEVYIPARRLRHVVNLGCGDGALEAELIGRDFADSYVGYDLSPDCVARATAALAGHRARVRFECTDLNHVALPCEAFDVAFFSHAAHHVERLEHLCEEVRAALRPDGFLLVQEFVGPNRMQWTDTQLAVVNRLLEQLPESLRLDLTRLPERIPKGPATRASVADWLRNDPSECVRSADILSVLAQSFEILERRDFGGTILQKLLENIVGNFREDDEAHSAIVRLLIAFETLLIEHGVLASDFTFVIARPRMR